MRIPYETQEELDALSAQYEAEGYVTERVESLLDGNFVTFKLPEIDPRKELKIVQQENAQLQLGMMELSMYAAAQDDKLAQQEAKLVAQEDHIKNHDSALMELSMILAGGM